LHPFKYFFEKTTSHIQNVSRACSRAPERIDKKITPSITQLKEALAERATGLSLLMGRV